MKNEPNHPPTETLSTSPDLHMVLFGRSFYKQQVFTDYEKYYKYGCPNYPPKYPLIALAYLRNMDTYIRFMSRRKQSIAPNHIIGI